MVSMSADHWSAEDALRMRKTRPATSEMSTKPTWEGERGRKSPLATPRAMLSSSTCEAIWVVSKVMRASSSS